MLLAHSSHSQKYSPLRNSLPWRGRHRRWHALWHLEEEELASPEIAEHSTASRICTLCDHESAFEPLFTLPRQTQFPCHPHLHQQPHSRSDNDSCQSGTQYTLAEFRVHKLIQQETSALISAETNVDRRAWIEECNSGDCDLLARDIFHEARLYDTSCTTLMVPLTLTLPTGFETKPTKIPSQPAASRHSGNRSASIKRKAEDMA